MSKLSVSLPEADVQTLDAYVVAHAVTRSAAIQKAIGLLREQSLLEQYDAVMDQWAQSADAADWDATTGDAL
jgi:metal-responsive CopG/Arc/MetJ family transcriptional regulator